MAKQILIADDDLSSLTILRMILQAGGHEVTTTKDGEAAWAELARGTVFDACIFDIMMPSLDGLELTKRVRGHPYLCEQPIILCTTLNDRATVARAVALSVTHYVVKPYARDHVLRQVELMCEEQQATKKLDPPPRTAQRLGIPEDQVAALLGDVTREIIALLPAFRNATPVSGETDPLVRASALKGATVNLGAFGLNRLLAALEGHGKSANAAALEETLREIEREAKRLQGILAMVPAPAGANRAA